MHRNSELSLPAADLLKMGEHHSHLWSEKQDVMQGQQILLESVMLFETLIVCQACWSLLTTMSENQPGAMAGDANRRLQHLHAVCSARSHAPR